LVASVAPPPPSIKAPSKPGGTPTADGPLHHSRALARLGGPRRSSQCRRLHAALADEGRGLGRRHELDQLLRGVAMLRHRQHSDSEIDVAPQQVRVGRRIPSKWIIGVASLEYQRAPRDVPAHRWRQFLSDCNSFLRSSQNWAERAAELGWDARALFGYRRNRPLVHAGSVGLLWAISGGRLVELHRDWAVIELGMNSRRVFERRRVDAAKFTLPWIERG
jgi:hypothetical protein